jgi:hypothetical protein
VMSRDIVPGEPPGAVLLGVISLASTVSRG